MSAEQIEVKPKWVIYVLVDPRIEDEMMRVRYVGKTTQIPTIRYNCHLNKSVRDDSHLGRWLRKMKREQVIPEMIIIEEGIGFTNWVEAEQYWISYFPNLTNTTVGGEGLMWLSENVDEIKEKISINLKEHWKERRTREGFIENLRKQASQVFGDYWKNPEHRKEHSRRLTIIKSTPESKEAMSKRSRRQWATPGFKENYNKQIKKFWAQAPKELRDQFINKASEQWRKAKEAGCKTLKEYRLLLESQK